MTIPDSDRIRSALTADVQHLDAIDCFDVIDSTNTWLMQQAPPKADRMRVAVAEHQTEGRGRHGRSWRSATGSSLCMSLSYTFKRDPESLPSLTLAVGVAVADALAGIGAHNVMLKWPNDLLINNAKIGGVLTESRVVGDSRANVVIGIGINLTLPQDLDESIESDWDFGAAGLDSDGGLNVDRDLVAAAIVDALSDALATFESSGIAAFEKQFEALDWLRGRKVMVDSADATVRGIAAGIASDGALLIDQRGGQQRVIAGSVRPDRAVSRERSAQ